MNIRLKKLVTAALGTAIFAGAVSPALLPEPAPAALAWAANNTAQAAPAEAATLPALVEAAAAPTAAESAEKLIEQPADKVVANSEVVVKDSKGNAKRVTVNKLGKETARIKVDHSAVNQWQKAVNSGKQLWRLDPVEVVKNNAAKYGFNAKSDSFTLISQISAAKKSKAYVLVGHGSKYYLVELNRTNAKQVWQISSIREASVVNKPDKPVVGQGVEGLDYNKVVKWQQNVDEGRELWRLDPMAVAKREGKQFYGLGDKAQFKIVRQVNSSPIARHGQIDLQVTQNGRNYTMILVRPLGSDSGAIWTTYKVYETVVQPGQPASKVIFQTNEYKNWRWQKPDYPQDMGVAAVYSRPMTMRAQTIPQPVFDQLSKVDLTKKVALLAYLGGTSSSHDIGIEKVTVSGSQMTVTVRAKSPRLNAPDIKDLVYPSDYVLVDQHLFSGSGLDVKFVDQNGKVLGTTKVKI